MHADGTPAEGAIALVEVQGYALLQALLGISADAPDNGLSVERRTLPDWLGSVEVCDIRVGGARVSLSFARTAAASTAFSLLEQEGDVRVTMSA